MKKTFKVVMLSTEKASEIFNIVDSPKLVNKEESKFFKKLIPQHLYILSDEEIKKGDWVINISASKDSQFPILMNSLHDEWGEGFEHLKKIVATTDKSLTIKDKINYGKESGKEIEVLLYQIPESFIQAYIKAYNEAKPITEVDLEMVEKCDDKCATNECICPYIIKTRPDNTVIVHQSKMYSQQEYNKLLEQIGQMQLEMYTRDEVIKLIDKYDQWCSEERTNKEFNKWIQDNL